MRRLCRQSAWFIGALLVIVAAACETRSPPEKDPLPKIQSGATDGAPKDPAKAKDPGKEPEAEEGPLNNGEPQVLDRVPLYLQNRVIEVEVADDPLERRIGLMHRRQMPEDWGMLFVYPEPLPLRFWMKDTLIPLSVAYLSDDGEVLSIVEMSVAPAGGPYPSYPTQASVRFALEMNAGWFQRHHIKAGDRIEGLDQVAGRGR